MSDTFYNSVLQELKTVRAELSKSEVYRRYRKLRELRDLYAPSASVLEREDGYMPVGAVNPPSRLRIRANPDRQKAIDLAQHLVSSSNEPVSTSDIYDFILLNGVRVAGEEPKNNLSAMLSNSGLFDANGRRGWTLKPTPEISNEEDDDDVEDTAAEDEHRRRVEELIG